MTQKVDIKLLATAIHAAMATNGFWDPRPHVHQQVTLAIGELSEGVEATRSKTPVLPDLEQFKRNLEAEIVKTNAASGLEVNLAFKHLYEKQIKGSREEEQADGVIRCLDLLGSLGDKVDWVDAQNYYDSKLAEFRKQVMETNYTIWVLTPMCWLSNVVMVSDFDTESSCEFLVEMLLKTIAYIAAYEPTLWEHVEIKRKYNALRPYKHGKTH